MGTRGATRRIAFGLLVAAILVFTVFPFAWAFLSSIKPDDEEALKKYRRDVQYTKLAGSFQAAAAGEAVEGIGEGAAKGGGVGGAAVIGAGLGLGAGIVAPAAAQVACPSCGAMNARASKFCSNCGHSLS